MKGAGKARESAASYAAKAPEGDLAGAAPSMVPPHAMHSLQ